MSNDKLNQALAELVHMQKELLQAEKNAALGTLVAGITHELNTPIGCCVTTATTLQYRAREFSGHMEKGITRSHMRDFVNTMHEGGDILVRNLDRAVKLLDSFKKVAVDQTANPESFNLQAVVNSVLSVESFHDSGYRFVNTVASDLIIHSYKRVFSDVLSELVHNAVLHAFEGREQGAVTVSVIKTGDGSIQLHVEDDGVGISKENLGRVFDPFFTTTMGQGGSGLGLHTAYNLVNTALRGTIAVDSTLGAGTRFTLSLPQLPQLT